MAALLTGTIARYASHGLCLRHARRMADERSEDRFSDRQSYPLVGRQRNRGRAVGTLPGRSAKLRSARREIATIRRRRRTVMFPIATTARRQARRSGRTQREQRRDNRKAKDDQQQDGKQLTQ